MGIVFKSVACVTIASGTIVGGRFVYKEKQCNSNKPQNSISIGSKDEKKAVVIGKYSLLMWHLKISNSLKIGDISIIDV